MRNTSISKSRRRKTAYIQLKQGSCIAKVYVSNRTRHGRTYTEYTLVYTFAGKRIRQSFADEAVARQAGQEALTKIANGQTHALQLTKADSEGVIWANDQLKPLNVSLFEAINEFLSVRSILGGKADPKEAARYFVTNGIAEIPSRTVGEVVADMVAAKEKDHCSEAHLRDLRNRLDKFAKAFPGVITDIKNPDIEAWLRSLPGAPRTRNNMAAIVTSLMRYALRNGLLPAKSNVGENLARARVTDSETLIFTPSELRQILDRLATYRPDLLPMVLLGAFAGLRTAEIERLNWEDINLEQGHIKISGGQSKTGERRLVPVQPVLKAWLTPYLSHRGPICLLRKAQEAMQETVEKTIIASDGTSIPGVGWKKNALRHSYGSYRLQSLKNLPALALEMGNSPIMIQKHYRELVTDAQANEYWSIYPEATSAQIVAMPSAV